MGNIQHLQTLEHLDGKQVRFSTITTQYPELFVKRKRNTGELIISTDTNIKYGMHHIYAGGEHIASGYGFATVKTRDDLTYIQETYNTIFNYFNDGYQYLSTGYAYVSNFAAKSYTNLYDLIQKHSYTNISVDSKYNKVNDYTLTVTNGTIRAVLNPNGFLTFDHPTYTYLSTNFTKHFGNFGNDSRSNKYTYNYNTNTGAFTYYTNFPLKINIREYIPENTYFRFSINNCVNDLYSEENIINTIHTTIGEIINNNRTKPYKESYCIVNIPIIKNKKATTIGLNTYTIDINKTEKNISYSYIYIDYLNEILIGCCDTLSSSDMLLNNTDNYTNAYFFVSYNQSKNNIDDNFSISITKKCNAYTYILLPHIQDSEPHFYVNSDISERGHNEGGFCYYGNIQGNSYIGGDISNTYNYDIYVSSYTYIQTELRYDIIY